MARLSSSAAERQIEALGAIPIDRVAYRVIGIGEHWEPSGNMGEPVFDAMPPARGMKRNYWERRPENMKGRTLGKLLVVGYWGPKIDRIGRCKGGAENQVWIVRCQCGLFAVRSALAIKKQLNPDDCCAHCQKLSRVHKRYIFDKTGKYPYEARNDHPTAGGKRD